MPKILLIALLATAITACSSALPEPPLDAGEWVPLPVSAHATAVPAPAIPLS